MSVSEAGDLKHRLAGWKELIVLVDSVLAWEKVSSVIYKSKAQQNYGI